MEANRAAGIGQPVDVANLVQFLASDEARQITGTTTAIDNGTTVRVTQAACRHVSENFHNEADSPIVPLDIVEPERIDQVRKK